MNENHPCPRCQNELPPGSPEGLCPRCLVENALGETLSMPDPDAEPGLPDATLLRYFGDYELLGEIGRGGMGVVYKARQVSLQRDVALKLIRAGRFASEPDVERFRREARSLAQLRHPNIVTIHEIGEHDGQPYFSMDLVEGPNLAERAAAERLTPEDVARTVRRLAETVQFAHDKGMIHRDLKPSNVLLDGGTPRITDFGLAKPWRNDDGIPDAGLTATGALVGTPSYMPPEQVRGRDGGPASDIYSLGAMLYELLAGRPPFAAETPMETALAVLADEPVPPRQVDPGADEALSAVCLRCLAKDPEQRYGSAGELAEELGRYLRGEPLSVRPAGRAERLGRWVRRRRRRLAWAAAIFMAFVLTLISVEISEDRFWASHLEQARSARLSGDATAAFDHLRQAAQVRRNQELRDEAMANLVASGPRLDSELPFGMIFWVDLDPSGDILVAGGTKPMRGPEDLEAPKAGLGADHLRAWNLADGTVHDNRTTSGQSFAEVGAWTGPGSLVLALQEHRVEKEADGGELSLGIDAEVLSGWTLSAGTSDENAPDAEPSWTLRSDRPCDSLGRLLVHPDGDLVVTGSTGRSACFRLWSDGRVRTSDVAAVPVAFLSRGEVLARSRGGLGVVDLDTGSFEKRLDSVLAVSGDGSVAVTWADGSLVVRALPEGRPVDPLAGFVREPDERQLRLSHDGRSIAVDLGEEPGRPGMTIAFFERRESPFGAPPRYGAAGRVQLPASGVAWVSLAHFHPSGSLVAVPGGDGGQAVVRIWDVASGREVARLEDHHHPRWSRDGRWLAAAGGGPIDWVEEDGGTGGMSANYSYEGAQSGSTFARRWRWSFPVSTFRHTEAVRSLVISPDGRWLSFNDKLFQWSDEGGRVHLRPTGVDVSGDPDDEVGRLLGPRPASPQEVVTPGGDRIVGGHGLSLANGEGGGMFQIAWPETEQRALALHPNGRLLAAGDTEGNIRLWDLGDNSRGPGGLRSFATWKAHDKWIHALAFHPEGHVLVSGGEDGRIRTWDLPVLRDELGALGLNWYVVDEALPQAGI